MSHKGTPLNTETKTIKMKQLLLIVSISFMGLASYAQTNKNSDSQAVQQRIEKVENSLSPLVLNEGEALWNLEQQMKKYNVSGLSIAVIHNYEIDWAKGYGSNGSKEFPNVTKQTVFQAASMSKFVNAVALMTLAQSNKIDLDEARYGLANMQLVARDRMREIKLWSRLKKEFDDGTFDTQDVNRHQLESYHHIMKNKAETLSSGSSQPEIFNVLGQLKTIERVKKSGEMIYNKKEQLTSDLGAKEK